MNSVYNNFCLPEEWKKKANTETNCVCSMKLIFLHEKNKIIEYDLKVEKGNVFLCYHF